ncbi:hypothetical protein GCM10010862_52100 [Devosia nitrariae]|uniref:Uncharacterized protein n=1 Tax=Devosia nitrariae TaxID=2071872 RepID=A0ABQ5WCY3_9HYPH|nr:hypothetical protein GCM10010862_52100 [Devosia nitrariae]
MRKALRHQNLTVVVGGELEHFVLQEGRRIATQIHDDIYYHPCRTSYQFRLTRGRLLVVQSAQRSLARGVRHVLLYKADINAMLVQLVQAHCAGKKSSLIGSGLQLD